MLKKSFSAQDPEDSLKHFQKIRERDLSATKNPALKESWKLLEDANKTGRLDHMKFETYLGKEHLALMFKWIHGYPYGNVPDRKDVAALVTRSVRNDSGVGKALKLDLRGINLDAIGYYNAQDYVFQRPAHQPERLNPVSILDFGAGHGRQANLLSQEIRSGKVHYCAMDATPSCYLMQRLYFETLGLKVADYCDDPDIDRDTASANLTHVPSWRFDLLKDNSRDMVIAVQVLRELSKSMLNFALANFARVLKPGGALYVRDHIGSHNPNMVDQDQALLAHGFVPEWYPRWIDRKDVHGIPRLWRKADPQALFGGL